MLSDEVDKQAREHAAYTMRVIRQSMPIDIFLNLAEMLYIEAYIHGHKHGVESCDSINKQHN